MEPEKEPCKEDSSLIIKDPVPCLSGRVYDQKLKLNKHSCEEVRESKRFKLMHALISLTQEESRGFRRDP